MALLLGIALATGAHDAGGQELASPDGQDTASPDGRVVELLSGTQAPDAPFRGTARFGLSQNTIQLEARLGDLPRARQLVLDSGAPTTLAPALARELGLPTLGEALLAGPEGGLRSVPVTRIPRLGLAGQTFRQVGAVLDWVAPPHQIACLSRDGLLGASLLQAAIWQLDFQTRRLTVTDRLSDLPGLGGATRIPFRRSDAAGSPRIEVGVNDRDDVSLLVDLGFNGGIEVPASLFSETGNVLPADAPARDGRPGSTLVADAASVLRIGRLRQLRLGRLRLPDLPVTTGRGASDFHVGIDFLRHFRVTLDWHQDVLHLELRAPEAALYDRYRSYGFEPVLDGGELVVGRLWRDSRAARAGMRLGDPVLEIDGRVVRRPDFATYCDLLDALGLFGSGTAPIRVAFRRGDRTETATLARTPLLPGPGEGPAPAGSPRPGLD